MVDEAKAFCPYCSHSFEPESERHASEFELTRNTDTFTQSFFNEVLSEMDLNISEAPDAQIKLAPEPRGRSRRRWLFVIGAAIFVFLILVVVTVILFFVLR